jgi:DNA polymerase-1
MQRQPLIFVDGSYYIFYRFHALKTWWRNAFPEESLDNPIKNTVFVEKFKKTFSEKLKEIPKKLNIDNPMMFIGKDCRQETIWRMKLYKDYKGKRPSNHQISPFFEIAYQIIEEEGTIKKLSFEELEADDCIALAVNRLKDKFDIYIITSDRDYLQLEDQYVHIYDLAFKDVAKKKSSFGNKEADLFCKIVMGDSSDNITSVLKKCGPKTALKCFEDRDYFETRLLKEDAYKKFQLNKTLVDFSCIPEELSTLFHEKYHDMLQEL